MNFTHAAEELHITQPAVSQHIKYLENYYSTKLFLQYGKKLLLTDSGRILQEKMNLIKNDETKLMDSLSLEPSLSKEISFGVTMTIGEYIIAPSIAKFLSTNPDTDFKIHFGNTEQLLFALEQGDIDFALVEGYFPKNEYDYMVYNTVDFIPVCNTSHNFSKKPKELKDLFSERIIIREPGSGTRNILERNLALQNYGIENFSHSIQVENMHTVTQLLDLDCGISFLYKPAVMDYIKKGTIKEIPLKDFSMKHDFTFLWQKGSIFSDEIQKICSELFML